MHNAVKWLIFSLSRVVTVDRGQGLMPKGYELQAERPGRYKRVHLVEQVIKAWDNPLSSDSGNGTSDHTNLGTSVNSSLPDVSGQPKMTLTVRMIMSGEEVGSIIGRGGEIINGIREESGANIHIPNGSGPERIVTVAGSTDAILKAFDLVSSKLENKGGGRGSGGEINNDRHLLLCISYLH